MNKGNRMLLRMGAVGLGTILAISPVHAAEHGMGFIAETEEVYNSFPTVPRFRAFLPHEADLSKRFPKPGDQGQQGACTAWAVGYGMRSYYQGQANHWDKFSSNEQVFSPAYIYNRLHEGAKDCDAGTAIPDALDLLVTEGIPTLSEFPYSDKSCSRIPDLNSKSSRGRSLNRPDWMTSRGRLMQVTPWYLA
jgi:hypothetical protein